MVQSRARGEGVVGRRWLTRVAEHLPVLLRQLHQRIEQAGLDPGCLERRHGACRLVVQEIELT